MSMFIVVYGIMIDEVMSSLKKKNYFNMSRYNILYITRCTKVLHRFTSPRPEKVYTLFVFRFII